MARGFWVIAIGVMLVVFGSVQVYAWMLLAGILVIVIAWTFVHPHFAQPIQSVWVGLLQRTWLPWIAATTLGGTLIYLSVWRHGGSAIGVLGGAFSIVGINRLGFNIRQRVSTTGPGLALVGFVVFLPAIGILVSSGFTLLVAAIAVMLLAILAALVVWRGRGPVVAGVLMGIGIWLGIWLYQYGGDSSPADPHDGAVVVLVAMGDSYMSGEGATRYLDGTNKRSENECRQASTAYAYRVAESRQMSLVFLACSGARTSHILQSEQFSGIGRQIDQLSAVKGRLGPGSAVLISIGGNDAGFGEIGRTCLVSGSCRIWAEQWLRSIRERVESDLIIAHRKVRSLVPDWVPVFAVTYPVAVTRTACHWSPLAADEHEFLATELTVDLNDAVTNAANVTGLNVIDLESALEDKGKRICDSFDPQNAAINLFGLGPVEGSFLDRINPTTWFHGSLHPTAEGHDIFDDLVAQAIDDKFTRMDSGEAANPEPMAVSRESRGRALLRFGEDDEAFVLLEEPRVSTAGEECPEVTPAAHSLAVFIETTDDDETGIQRVYGAEPGSVACLRDHTGTWSSVVVSEDGVLPVPWAFPDTHQTIEAFYERSPNQTAVLDVVFCRITPTRCPSSGTSQWMADQLRLLVLGVGLPVWALVVIGANLVFGILRSRFDWWGKHVLSGPASTTFLLRSVVSPQSDAADKRAADK